MATKPTHFAISVELAQAVLDYLGARPYAEVHQLVPPLLNMPVVNPPKPKADPAA